MNIFTVILTNEDLKKIGACARARRNFRGRWSQGMPITPSNILKEFERDPWEAGLVLYSVRRARLAVRIAVWLCEPSPFAIRQAHLRWAGNRGIK